MRADRSVRRRVRESRLEVAGERRREFSSSELAWWSVLVMEKLT